MAEISAAQVRALREKTGLPMMECKAALTEANGNEQAAIELLQRKAKGKLETKAHRETAEGRVGMYISPDGRSGALVELRCETPPVAKNEMFAELSNQIAQQVAAGTEASPSPERILTARWVGDSSKTVNDLVEGVFARIKENMKLVRCRRITGEHLVGYVHFDGSIGVMAALDKAPATPQVGKDLCMHIAFAKPLGIMAKDVPAEEIEQVRRMAAEVARGEGKPEKIIDKIVEGKVAAFYKEKVLMEQEHVKEPKTSVAKVLKAAGVDAVTAMVIMQVGGQ
jgi:elongation factor Ts